MMAYIGRDGKIKQFTHKTDALNGLRVHVIGEGSEGIGTVVGCHIDPENAVAEVGVDMDTGGWRWMFYNHLELEDASIRPSILPRITNDGWQRITD